MAYGCIGGVRSHIDYPGNTLRLADEYVCLGYPYETFPSVTQHYYYFLLGFGILPHAILYLHGSQRVGASAFEIGLNTVLFTLVQILTAGFIGKKVRKWLKPHLAVTISFLLMGLRCLLAALTTPLPIWLWEQ